MLEDVIRGKFKTLLELRSLLLQGLERIRGLGWLNITKRRLASSGINIQKHEALNVFKYARIMYFSGICSSIALLMQGVALFWNIGKKM
jgi:hypothetical protein